MSTKKFALNKSPKGATNQTENMAVQPSTLVTEEDEEGGDAPEAQEVDAMRALDALAGELAVENVRGGADRQRAAWATISLVPTGAGTGRPPSGHGH